ncbi:MAG: cytochrome c [Planctomycetota bacterium]|nr:MAG: cytochrome c [Planctomycetota bacterium]
MLLPQRSLIVFFVGVAILSGASASIAADRTGEQIYREACASCHGKSGEGTIESYPHSLVGERSVGELSDYISKTMPEDKPGTIVGEEARKVSQFIHETFYSPTAQARNKPVRVELSRLTVRQYRNAVADLIGSFRGAGRLEDNAGLRGEYFKARGFRRDARAIERVDPVVGFDFKDKSPDDEKMEPHEFSIRWEGAVTAPDTGEYEFIVRTDQAARLWINDLKQPLVDNWVQSGKETEHRESIFLLAGRTYALKLEFSKAKQGVDDKKAKEKPPAPAFISLEWQRPHRVAEVIASRYLSTSRPNEAFVVTTKFPPDDRSVGWEKATSISKEWDQATTAAAIDVATFVASRFEEFAGTKRDAPDRDEKLKAFCRRFVERAFRRPLDDEQRKIFVDRHFAEGVDAETAVNRVVLLALKSPRFLYRERGSAAQTSEVSKTSEVFDVASRISFAMYDSLPDQALLDAAAKGELKTREQVAQHATRLLADPRTRSKLREFLLTWLKVEHVPDVSKDTERFPEFNATIANDLRTSLELSLDEIIKSEQADFRQLLLTDSIFLNGRLAKFYSAKMPDEEAPNDDAPFQKVELEPELGSSSPIHRGIFIARSVLGRSLRPPPEAVAPLAPHLRPDLTTRERVALQTKPEACQSCHAMINPLGFTLEHFDAVGRFRKDENGKPVDASGTYRTRNGDLLKFSGVNDLAKFLADSPETHSAFVEQLFHFLIKQPIRAFGSNTRETLRASFVKDNFNIHRLMVEIVATAALTTNELKPQTASPASKP